MPVMRKMFNGFIAMALTVVGNKRFNPKIIADPQFIKITNVDEKMTGLSKKQNNAYHKNLALECDTNDAQPFFFFFFARLYRGFVVDQIKILLRMEYLGRHVQRSWVWLSQTRHGRR